MLNAMIVEDNAIYRYAISSIIRWEDYGFTIVSEALNGVHALEILQQQQVDFIVTDITMPEMNGIELIRQVKQKDAGIKIVALSSYDDFRFVKEALKLGAEDYLLKHDLEPGALQELLLHMKDKIMADRQQRKQAHIREANWQEMQVLLGRKLLLGEMSTAEEMDHQAAAIHFPILSGPTAVILIEGMFENMPDEVADGMRTMVIPIRHQRTVVIAALPADKSERKGMEETRRLASQLVSRMKGTVTAGISAIGCSLKDWSSLYSQAEAALEQSVYEGAGSLYTYSGRNRREAGHANEPVPLGPLNAAMKSGVQAEGEAALEQFFLALMGRRPPLAELKPLLLEAALLVKTYALERQTPSPQLELAHKQLVQWMEGLPQLDQVKQVLFDLYRSGLESGRDQAVMRKEIQAAMRYIDEHYAEDITVARMAEVLHLSSNYLSNLFKQETGMRIIEYINRCRIRRAKLLLQDSAMKVYEVAEKTGFQEVSYFCKVFKELEGRTVTDFRSALGR
ncbi:response regulator transcription factor [Paenibacillus aestuarii]|uniref:Response regulator n=1 Tax=Paenibacillus aestuarii TaxID=516965 RepID=A0ABW0K5A2_9BACL|nr:response regulator [Paenibacillus aestuarii]